MDYYLYQSRSKIEMLWEQMPRKRFNSLSAKLGFNLGFANGEISANPESIDIYQKIRFIEEFLKRKTGYIFDPKEYVHCLMDVSWGQYENYEDMVYFSGHHDGVVVGLAGSMRNCIGSGNSTSLTSYSLSSAITQALVSKRIIPNPIPGFMRDYSAKDRNTQQRVLDAVCEGHLSTYGKPQDKIEFLAKTLQTGTSRLNSAIWLGTPIYVRLVN